MLPIVLEAPTINEEDPELTNWIQNVHNKTIVVGTPWTFCTSGALLQGCSNTFLACLHVTGAGLYRMPSL
jgi:hypothetical protein